MLRALRPNAAPDQACVVYAATSRDTASGQHIRNNAYMQHDRHAWESLTRHSHKTVSRCRCARASEQGDATNSRAAVRCKKYHTTPLICGS